MRLPNGFQFKQFHVLHDLSSMKVGTDAVLVGAWSPLPVSSSLRILDIGTGSGVIALMLAQRTQEVEECLIDAIDIDEPSVNQANSNFAASPWGQRLKASLSRVQDWQGQYDMIVSNPPYFVDSLTNPDVRKAAARHTQTLSYEELMFHAARLMKEGGVLSLITPIDQQQTVQSAASEQGLYLNRLLRVRPKPGKPITRLLYQWQKGEVLTPPSISELTIEDETHPRSQEYISLTKDFYL